MPGAAGHRLGGRQGDAAHRRGRRPSGRGTGDLRVEASGERGEDKLPGQGGEVELCSFLDFWMEQVSVAVNTLELSDFLQFVWIQYGP